MLNLRAVSDGYMPRMSHVYRYSSIAVNRRESIAEHSWWVTFLAMSIGIDINKQRHEELAGVPEVDIGLLVTRALVHDIDETMSGDIIRSFKHTNATVRSAIEMANVANIRILLPDSVVGEKLQDFIITRWGEAKDDDLEGDIVSFADQVAVVFYCMGEDAQGNRNAAVVLEELYTNWFKDWHAHPILGPYADQLFPGRHWEGPIRKPPVSMMRPIMRIHSEGATAAELPPNTSFGVPLS